MHMDADMEISFSNAKLAKLCNSEKKLRGKHGPRMAALISQRLFELDAADTLEEMRALPGPRCHALSENLSGLIAVDLVHPDRLVFTPNHKPLPARAAGGLDWRLVKKIEIVGIGNYH